MKLIFVDINGKQELVDYIRLKEEAGKAAVFRFYALEMLGNKLNIGPTPDLMPLLNPDSELGDQTSKVFDEKYAEQLSNLPSTKYDLMIMLEQLQLVEEVIVVCNYNHPTIMPIVDSLCKYIQQKYTIQAYLVSDMDDINPFELSEFDTDEGYDAYIRDVLWLSDARGDIDKQVEELKKEKEEMRHAI